MDCYMDPIVVQAVLDRDCYACVICGSDDRIQIAHIASRGSRPDLYNEMTNLCVLCYECHMVRMHSKAEITAAMIKVIMNRKYGYDYGRSSNG